MSCQVDKRGNPKSEGRRPKEGRSPKSEVRGGSPEWGPGCPGGPVTSRRGRGAGLGRGHERYFAAAATAAGNTFWIMRTMPVEELLCERPDMYMPGAQTPLVA